MPMAGGHEVELTWLDRLHRPEAVAVLDRALEQPGHGLQADVRVRRHPHAGHVITASGPKWSTKHQAPIIRRSRCGSVRLTMLVFVIGTSRPTSTSCTARLAVVARRTQVSLGADSRLLTV